MPVEGAGRRVAPEVRIMTDIIAAIDEATGCQECGKPLGRSPSDDFCSEICQRTWHARQGDEGVVPSFRGATPDVVIMDELAAWAGGAVSYGEFMLRASAAETEAGRVQRRAEKERLFAQLYNGSPPADLLETIPGISIAIEVAGEAARQFGEALNGFLADTAHEHRWMPDEPVHECRCAVTNPPCSHCTDCATCNVET